MAGSEGDDLLTRSRCVGTVVAWRAADVITDLAAFNADAARNNAELRRMQRFGWTLPEYVHARRRRRHRENKAFVPPFPADYDAAVVARKGRQ